jgi:hypothetical protein
MMTEAYTLRTLYGDTGQTWYCRFVHYRGNEIWDSTNQELGTATAWADSAVVIVETPSGAGAYPVVVPANLPAGIYDCIVHDGATPAVDDTIVASFTFQKGSDFGF